MGSPERYDIFGDPEIVAHAGNDFQANIPSLVVPSDANQQLKSQNDVNIAHGVFNDRFMGLPIPLVWMNQNSDNRTAPMEDYCCHFCYDSSDSSSWHPDVGKIRGKGHFLVPGSESKQWSDIEEAGFLLGLYIFGKNFVILKKFVGRERMGDVISFYYGKFYKSVQYQRWSECRQNKSRKCAYGHKIFTGSRQQELVSRLISSSAKELQGTLLEVSKSYAVGNSSVEEYVFILKNLVGMECLVKAVAIGKGKKDLTGPSVDFSKSNQTLHTCLDVPAGKAWSSLSTAAIIEFLTGNVRLSKAKSIDLFWEAVWPRLLDRGWHSEQPKGYAYVSGSKQSLVFLVPGVTKFSRRKLVKGEDYFDSVSDILNKIAMEPMLLGLEAHPDQRSHSKVTVAAKLDDDVEHSDLVDGQNAYLKLRDSNPDIDFVGLTVIDTTFATAVTGKMREVTYWPVKSLNMPLCRSQFQEIENDILEEPREESDSGNASCFEQNASKLNAVSTENTISRSHANDRVSASLPKQINKDVSTSAVAENQLQKKKSRLKKSINRNCFVDTPLTVKKQKVLTVCSHQEPGQNTITPLLYGLSSKREDKDRSCHHLSDPGDRISQMGSKEKLASQTCLTNHSSKNCSETNIVSPNNAPPHEKPRPRMVLDLNLPYCSDIDLDAAPDIEIKENNGTVDIEQEHTMNFRRHSTRNRPLTAKVLDAIADGFFEVTPKRKRKRSSSPDSNRRPSQQARAGVTVTSNDIMITGLGARKSDMEGNVSSSASINNDMLLNFQQPRPMGDKTLYI
uniref:SANT domain-containing protein n=1 Tax=Kalanchoe fedtschenkoi TaxID=63787 RepID=A0A7N0T2H5_KALFE